MSALSGIKMKSPVVQTTPAAFSANVGANAINHSDLTYIPSPRTCKLSGDLANAHLPIEVLPQVAFSGIRMRSFKESYYYRVHARPYLLELGNLISSQTRTIELWNAWPENTRTISAVTPFTADGLTITGTVPKTLNPLQAYNFTLAIDSLGPASIDGGYVFEVDTPEAPRVRVTGNRVVAFPFRVNFANSFIDRLEFLTDVITARSGKEQRITLRDDPRRSWDAEIVLPTLAERAQFRALMFGWQHRIMAVGYRPDWTPLSTTLAPGALEIPATSTEFATRDYAVGSYVMLWISPERFEVLEVLNVAADKLTLKNPTSQTWPARWTRVMPCRLATVPQELTVDPYTLDAERAQVQFQLLASEQGTWRNGTATDGTYRGIEVWRKISDESLGIPATLTRQTKVIDNSTGLYRLVSRQKSSRWAQQFRWVMRDRQAVSDFLGFFYRRRGRQNPVWVPSWAHDYVLQQPISDTQTAIVVRRVGHKRYYDGVENKRDLAFIAPGRKTMTFKRILSSSENSDGTETLQLDSAFGVSLTTSAFDRISLLRPCRLESDSIDIEWPHGGWASSTFKFVELITSPA